MRKYHEVANIFPLIEGADFDALKADIAANGLREDIWLHPDESIVDGRNRYRACMEVGVEPRFKRWEEKQHGPLLEFVLSLNLHRRQLEKSQLAFVALNVEKYEFEQNEKIRLANLKQNAPDVAILPHREQGKSRDKAAAAVGVGARYVQDAKKVMATAPDLAQQVMAGTITLPEAKRQVNKRQRKDAPPLPDGKYRIWYADPPWKYGNSGVITEDDNYGRAERHYPSMSIGELCEMGPHIKSVCEDDAVLFMWVTSPLLEECFPVINAWGFKYKTSFVWDKVGHNFGHYNSVRHEMLLVCTRGSCTPDDKTLFDSVVSIEKSRKHSEKPEEFRRIIDTLYTYGKRIELFARSGADGWDAWGNEC